MKNKGTGLIEYLLTYGWAILVVMVVGIIMWQMGIFGNKYISPYTNLGTLTEVRKENNILWTCEEYSLTYPTFEFDAKFPCPDELSKCYKKIQVMNTSVPQLLSYDTNDCTFSCDHIKWSYTEVTDKVLNIIMRDSNYYIENEKCGILKSNHLLPLERVIAICGGTLVDKCGREPWDDDYNGYWWRRCVDSYAYCLEENHTELVYYLTKVDKIFTS